MRFTVSVVLAIGMIAILLAAGCADIKTAQQVKDFGTTFGASPEQQKLIDWFKTNYGDPTTNNNDPPRFVLPMVTTGISEDNMPVDNVQIFPKDGGSVYFLAVYDNFRKGDPINVKWVYLANGNEVASVDQQAGDDFGRLIVEFRKPASGWGVGKQEITVTGKGATAKVNFEIGSEKQTAALPWEGKGRSLPGKEPSGLSKEITIPTTAPTIITAIRASDCPYGGTKCDGKCVNFAADSDNCGACGKFCPWGKVCINGICGRDCGPGFSDCGSENSCYRLDTYLNCGKCGNVCPAGTNCINGACTHDCMPPTTKCNNNCFDLSYDLRNCGRCNNICPEGYDCTNGVCTAPYNPVSGGGSNPSGGNAGSSSDRNSGSSP